MQEIIRSVNMKMTEQEKELEYIYNIKTPLQLRFELNTSRLLASDLTTDPR